LDSKKKIRESNTKKKNHVQYSFCNQRKKEKEKERKEKNPKIISKSSKKETDTRT